MSIVPYQVTCTCTWSRLAHTPPTPAPATAPAPAQTFPTSSGHLTIGCGNSSQFTELCARLGEAGLAADPRFATNEGRVAAREEVVARIAAILQTRSNVEWCQAFQGVSFPYGPVNKMSEVFEDPQVVHLPPATLHLAPAPVVQVQHLGLEQHVHHPPLARRVAVVGPAVSYSASANRVRGPPPALGQHTDQVGDTGESSTQTLPQVLQESLGMTEQQIIKLREDGVIG